MHALWLGAVRLTARSLPELGLEETARARSLPVLDLRQRGTAFVALRTRSVLNSPAQTGMGWSVNPYVGCEFGCTYCYARYAHRYVVEPAEEGGLLGDRRLWGPREPADRGFERRIFVKEAFAAILAHDLRRAFRAPAPIVLGTATDPYQPAERRFRLTRAALTELARHEGLSIGIITKSPLITRDRDLLQRLAERSEVEILISLISVDPQLVRLVEARSPMPAARLRALAKLAQAGLNVGVIVAPVLPGLTDGRRELEAVASAARSAGARFLYAGTLRLYGPAREHFLPVIERSFPSLAARYRRAYGRAASAPPAYRDALRRRVCRVREKFGFPAEQGMEDRYRSSLPPGQLSLGV